MYQAANIGFSIGKNDILRSVNISLQPGEFTAVIGPNGAGKSTLLKTLAYEHQLFRGDVMINGKNVRSYSSKALSTVRAVLPQSTHVQFSFSVAQIILLGRHAHNATRKENENILEEVMHLTDTTTFRDRNYNTLSGGEKQRVQLARVLAQVWEETVYPRYVLLDEPTSNLDIAQQQLIFSLARQSCSRNIGVMAIVHDLNQAVQFADHLYFMRDGEITATGRAHEVFTKSNIEETFCCRVNVYHDPCNKCPYIVPDRRGMESEKINYREAISK
jgi:iron complex transport system ATP-binding protein